MLKEDAKDASVSECTWTLSALEALHNALYKFKTYLLTIKTLNLTTHKTHIIRDYSYVKLLYHPSDAKNQANPA